MKNTRYKKSVTPSKNKTKQNKKQTNPKTASYTKIYERTLDTQKLR